MPNPDPTLLKYASSCFQQGYTEPEIRRFLIQAGYDPASINVAMNTIRGAPAPPTTPTPPTPPSREGAAQWGGTVPWGAAPPSSTMPPAFSQAPSGTAAQSENDSSGSGWKKTVYRGIVVLSLVVVIVSVMAVIGANVRRSAAQARYPSSPGSPAAHRIQDPCVGISDEDKGVECYMQIGYGVPASSYCDGLGNRARRSLCVIGYVNKTGNPSLCESKIEDPARVPACYFIAAISTRDPSLCENIIDDELRKSCYTRIAVHTCLEKSSTTETRDCFVKQGYDTADSSFCAELPVTGSGPSYCLIGFVNKTGDASICDSMIEDAGLQHKCYEVAAISKKDFSLCERITNDSSLRDSCLSGVAAQTNDHSVCGMMTSSDNCYRTIAVNTKDVTLCGRIVEAPNRNGCIIKIVKATGDTAFCNEIEPGFRRDECLGEKAATTPVPTTVPTALPTPIPTIEPTSTPTPPPEPTSASTPTPTPKSTSTPTPTPTPSPTPTPTPIPVPDTITDLDLDDMEIAFIQAFDSGAVSLSQIKNKRKETIAITSVSTCTGEDCTVSEAEGCQGVSGEDLFGTEVKFGDYIYLQNCYNNGEGIVRVFEGQEITMKVRLSYKVSGSDSELSTATAEFTIKVQEAQTPLVTPVPPPESYIMDLPFERFNAHYVLAWDTGEIKMNELNNTGDDNVSIRGILTCLGDSCVPKLSPECIGYSFETKSEDLEQTLEPGTGLVVYNCYNNGDSYEPKAEGEEITFGLAIDYTVVDTLEKETTETKYATLKVSKSRWELETNPLDLPETSDYSVWTVTSTVPYNFSKPPGFPWNQTSYPGTEYISYARMDPLLPAIYQNWVERGLPTAEIVVMTKMAIACGACPDEEITEVKASVKIEGLTDWQEKSYASVTNEITDGTFAGLPTKTHSPTTLSFSIPTSFEVFSFEQKKVPIHFKLSYKYNGEPKDWSSTEALTVGSRNDFTYRKYIADYKGDTELQDYTGLIATFVTPRDPKVQEIITQAKELLPDRTFGGYQGKPDEVRENVMEQVAAIYKAIQNMDVSYVDSSVSYSGSQNIRLPADSIGEASANCIDGTLLFASAFERVGINPMAVLDFNEGHAYVGFQIDEHEKEFVFLDTVYVGNHKLPEAIKAGDSNVKDCSGPNCILIDIAQARDLGINPIATG